MKIDVSYDFDQASVQVSFFMNQFDSKKDTKTAINIVRAFCAEFDLDPELDEQGFDEIIERVQELDNDLFTFMINEEGVEVEISSDE